MTTLSHLTPEAATELPTDAWDAARWQVDRADFNRAMETVDTTTPEFRELSGAFREMFLVALPSQSKDASRG